MRLTRPKSFAIGLYHTVRQDPDYLAQWRVFSNGRVVFTSYTPAPAFAFAREQAGEVAPTCSICRARHGSEVEHACE